MPSTWETFPIQLTGGLTTNLSRLQHGLQAPGAPRVLRNFEPSLRGGYRRVNGYNKYSDNVVPSYGDVKVQGSGQTGTTLVVANLFEEPQVGDTLTISGVTGTYTISAVVYTTTSNSASLTLSTSLASSPTDKASVTIANTDNLIQGLWVGSLNQNLKVLVIRGGVLYEENSGWVKSNTPNYGTVLVAGASQTGTDLDVDGVTSSNFSVGDTFTIDGIELVYTVVSATTPVSGATTLTITPALDSSPADNASVTILSNRLGYLNKCRAGKFNFDGTEKVIFVDGASYPSVYSGTDFEVVNGTTDVLGAKHVTEFKNHLFFSKGDLITFTVPFEQNDFDTGSGAGSFRVPDDVTGLVVFREQLIIFTRTSVHRLVGNSVSDFQLSSISNSLGCVEEDTIQEVGGDIVYMGPDGIRFLGATERIGDFSLALASKIIQDKILNLKNDWNTFHAIPIRSKSQYRIFGYTLGVSPTNAPGYLATQFMDQDMNSMQWAELRGFPVYVASSNYFGSDDYVVFANNDGYVYRMEQGSSMDGETIFAKMTTPFMSINDPRFRKTIYKLHTYLDSTGDVQGTVGLSFDFEAPNKIQPVIGSFTSGGEFATYGFATYGVSEYGGSPDTVSSIQTVGAGYQVSIDYKFNNTNSPFILDTIILEYATEGRL